LYCSTGNVVEKVNIAYNLEGSSPSDPLVVQNAGANTGWDFTARADADLVATANVINYLSIASVYSIQADQKQFPIYVKTNSSMSGVSFNQNNKALSFSLNVLEETCQFANVTFPKTLLDGTFNVSADENIIPFQLVENSTNYSIYATYPNGTSTLQITVNPTISASAEGNGAINPTGNVTVNFGSSQNFNVTANVGYHIVDVMVDNVSQGAVSSYTFTNVTTAHSITASFAINTYQITVTQTSNGNINPGTTPVNYGSTPSFTITPNAGYHIASIAANGGSVAVTNSSGQTHQFSPVTADGSLTATYAINTYTITVTQTVNGVIAPGTTIYNYGSTPSFNITANAGYHIASITANGGSVTVTTPSSQTYQFSALTANGNLTATYAINTYSINVTQTANGVISPGTTVVNYGDS
jgi:hypothetical protein